MVKLKWPIKQDQSLINDAQIPGKPLTLTVLGTTIDALQHFETG